MKASTRDGLPLVLVWAAIAVLLIAVLAAG